MGKFPGFHSVIFAGLFAFVALAGAVVKEERTAKKTINGNEFKPVSEEVLKQHLGIKASKKFGEAWKDPSGMIWGDIAREADGSPLFMNHRDAVAYCNNLGAELPTGYKSRFPIRDSDFMRLSKYMGAESVNELQVPEGYMPQILPNLTYAENEVTYSRYFWSSSFFPDDPRFAYSFYGHSGVLEVTDREDDQNVSVRCVVMQPR